MKRFNEILEGILAGQDATLQKGDVIAKDLAEAKDILKMVPTIEAINSRLMNKYPNRNTDANGIEVRKGDLIGFTNGNFLDDNGLRYGIVVGLQPSVAGYTVLVGDAGYDDEVLELYPGAAAYFVDACNCIVLAGKKDAPTMLKLLSKLR
jgi:hypothetical protein